MVGDKRKKVEGGDGSPEQIKGERENVMANRGKVHDHVPTHFTKRKKKRQEQWQGYARYKKKVKEGEWSLEQLEGEEASDKVLDIDQKHKETRKRVYDKRNEIRQSINNFQLNFFLEPLVLGKHLTDEDQKIFKYLDALDVEDSKDVESGYSITFNFRPNPFFEDSKLTKTYTFLDEVIRITATSIKWKEGMGLPNGAAREKKGNKGPLSGESFFHWFSDAEHKDVTAEIHDEIADLIMNSWANYYIDADKAYGRPRLRVKKKRLFCSVAPHEGRPMLGTTSYNQVSKEETAAAYVYKMDKTWLRPDEVRVEIRRGNALWVIGQGDEPVKVELPRLKEMRVSEATASMNADGVLTVVIPKRHGPWKWYEYKNLVFAFFHTVCVDVSS